ncbi:MAG: hypothetical protein JF615_02885 [Asticcacaulis sp.]|nr:hypothetical protein [Asticcacaulis sp.]
MRGRASFRETFAATRGRKEGCAALTQSWPVICMMCLSFEERRMLCRVLIPVLMLGLALPVGAQETSAISHEPFYVGLISQAERLKVETDGFTPSLSAREQPAFQAYTQDIRTLSDGDLAGHLDLKKRGTDSDLKCILKGVSLDLNIKMDAILAATSDAEMKGALDDMSHLLSDNVDVIVTPETAESGLDCVIEFGPGVK